LAFTGDLILGIRDMKIWLIEAGKIPEFRADKEASITSLLTIS